MSIIRTPYVYDANLKSHVASGEPVESYKGRVVQVRTQCERIMSDVWDDVQSALVYSPETKGEHGQYNDYKWVFVCCYGDTVGKFAKAVVDAPEGHLAAYIASEAAERARIQKMEQELRDSETRKWPSKGKVVEVVKGHKVPKGTKGLVFWEGNNRYGNTVGIALNPEKGNVVRHSKTYRNSYVNTVFVSVSNVVVVGSESQEAMEAAVKAWEASAQK